MILIFKTCTRYFGVLYEEQKKNNFETYTIFSGILDENQKKKQMVLNVFKANI